jgi:chromosome segregation ATPase
MMQWRRLEIALGLALGVALVVSVGLVLRQSRRLAACRAERARDLESLRQLREALPPHELAKTPAEAEGRPPVNEIRAALVKRDATIAQLNRELGEARAQATDLQAQILKSSEEREQALAAANERLRKEQEDGQAQLDALKQAVDSAQAELEASRQRLAALEADNAKLRNANREGAARTAELARAVADLEDLDQHREAYLTSIMRRYRDLTSQFRAMSGMLDSSRDPNSIALSGAALTRIQNAISLADDDLRQLSELNAKARQLENKLAKK